MAFRILAVLLTLWASGVYPDTPRPRWIYYPTNSAQNGDASSGLHIYFENPTAETASVSVAAIRDRQQIRRSKVIRTDCSQGGCCWFPLNIGDLDSFHVLEIDIEMGRLKSVARDPEEARYYYF